MSLKLLVQLSPAEKEELIQTINPLFYKRINNMSDKHIYKPSLKEMQKKCSLGNQFLVNLIFDLEEKWLGISQFRLVLLRLGNDFQLVRDFQFSKQLEDLTKRVAWV